LTDVAFRATDDDGCSNCANEFIGGDAHRYHASHCSHIGTNVKQKNGRCRKWPVSTTTPASRGARHLPNFLDSRPSHFNKRNSESCSATF
jgi:hypothetical protein